MELHYKLSMKVSSSFTRELLEINYNYSNYEECMRQNDSRTPHNNENKEMKLIPLSSIIIIYYSLLFLLFLSSFLVNLKRGRKK